MAGSGIQDRFGGLRTRRPRQKARIIMQKHPDIPVTFLLEQNSRYPFLSWRVIWGTSVASSGYSVYVNASTGQFVEKIR